MEDSEEAFIQHLRACCSSIQRREGDQGLRQTLLVERVVVSRDHQVSPENRQVWLDALRQIERELLPRH
jgi:hypothetical protein